MREAPPSEDLAHLLSDMVFQYQLSEHIEEEGEAAEQAGEAESDAAKSTTGEDAVVPSSAASADDDDMAWDFLNEEPEDVVVDAEDIRHTLSAAATEDDVVQLDDWNDINTDELEADGLAIVMDSAEGVAFESEEIADAADAVESAALEIAPVDGDYESVASEWNEEPEASTWQIIEEEELSPASHHQSDDDFGVTDVTIEADAADVEGDSAAAEEAAAEEAAAEAAAAEEAAAEEAAAEEAAAEEVAAEAAAAEAAEAAAAEAAEAEEVAAEEAAAEEVAAEEAAIAEKVAALDAAALNQAVDAVPNQEAHSIDESITMEMKQMAQAQMTENPEIQNAAIAAAVAGGMAAPVTPHPLLERMAVEALRLNASDIFISTGFAPAFKIDGAMTPAPVKPLSQTDAAKIIYSTMNAAQRVKFAEDLELNYSLQAKNGVRFRVNAYHEQGRVGLVMRRLTTEIATVDDLLLPQALKKLAMRPRGLIILAGATGSGKSTSMAAMLDWRNEHHAGHIVTIEDPIEYIHRPKKSIITHREVGIDTHSWSNAVQSAMRQAPDVVCVGEVRNELSLEYAMQLAQTGHLCFFTVHANNANQAVERILNFFPEERHQQVLMDLALNLVCIIGQRLVVKKGGKGRIAIVDLLINTPAMQDYIFKGQLMEMKDLMEKAEQDGMQTFDQDLFDLYCDDVIDYDEALRQADSVNDLRLRIKLFEEGRETEHIFDRVDDLNLM